jgi:choline dehydrogenase-like flavoprotein
VKAVICGAGIAGLTAAHELAELGWEVTLLEQAPTPRIQGYMIDFFGPGYDAAERMYVLPQLAELGYQVDELRYHDDAGRTRARLSYRRIADALDGGSRPRPGGAVGDRGRRVGEEPGLVPQPARCPRARGPRRHTPLAHARPPTAHQRRGPGHAAGLPARTSEGLATPRPAAWFPGRVR